MNLFRVEVDCWYDTVNTRKPKRVREQRILLVEATDMGAARDVGVELAEDSSACGVRLVAVEWRRVTPVDLPAELNGILIKPTCFRELSRQVLKSSHGKWEAGK